MKDAVRNQLFENYQRQATRLLPLGATSQAGSGEKTLITLMWEGGLHRPHPRPLSRKAGEGRYLAGYASFACKRALNTFSI
jgi:hypothetical protein